MKRFRFFSSTNLSFHSGIGKLNLIRCIGNTMFCCYFEQIIIIQWIRKNIENIHQSFDHHCTAGQMWKTSRKKHVDLFSSLKNCSNPFAESNKCKWDLDWSRNSVRTFVRLIIKNWHCCSKKAFLSDVLFYKKSAWQRFIWQSNQWFTIFFIRAM